MAHCHIISKNNVIYNNCGSRKKFLKLKLYIKKAVNQKETDNVDIANQNADTVSHFKHVFFTNMS